MSPESAPLPHSLPHALQHSPAAERNAPHILLALQAWLPPQAQVLEVASGTGQHAQHFATATPAWEWQPTEASAAALATITARCGGLPGVRAPLVLDVLAARPVPAASVDAVYAANLLHIAPWAVTPAFMQGAARTLRAGGVLVVYGPFIVEGEPLAPSNAAFDADLRTRNPLWGLRALRQVRATAAAAGLQLAECLAMPANNLLLRFLPGASKLDN
jgi:SAM-dependent methyltransferase